MSQKQRQVPPKVQTYTAIALIMIGFSFPLSRRPRAAVSTKASPCLVYGSLSTAQHSHCSINNCLNELKNQLWKQNSSLLFPCSAWLPKTLGIFIYRLKDWLMQKQLSVIIRFTIIFYLQVCQVSESMESHFHMHTVITETILWIILLIMRKLFYAFGNFPI